MESSGPAADETLLIFYRVERATEVAYFEVPLGVSSETVGTSLIPLHDDQPSLRAIYIYILPVVKRLSNPAQVCE